MKHIVRAFAILAVFDLLLAPDPALAQDLSKDQAPGLAAARADAFVNLTSQVYAFPSTVGRTVNGLVSRDAKLRDALDAALMAAEVVGRPTISSDGLVHVVVELDTWALPYDLRSKATSLPRRIQADGVADVNVAMMSSNFEIAGVTIEVAQWAAAPLEAEGEAAVRAARDTDEAKRAARRLAITNAYTALAQKAFELPLDAGVTIAAFASQHPELRPHVNAALAGAALASESLDVQGKTYKVKISLPGRALMPPLRLGRFRSDPGKVLQKEMIALARANAGADAESNLKKRIYGLPLRSGIKAADLIAKRERMKQRIDRLCQTRPIDRVEITRDGVAKVYISLATRELPNELFELLAPKTAPRLDAVGGGLPLRKAKPRPAQEPAPGQEGAAEKGAAKNGAAAPPNAKAPPIEKGGGK
ncbi:MAG: hypothetical protein ABIF82_12710 [Planctomycetota bacterium]